MPLYKSAQEITMDNITDLGDKDEVILYEDKPEPEDVIELHQPEENTEKQMVVFKLPALPGCPDKEHLEVSTDDENDLKPEEMAPKTDAKLDPWDWQTKGAPHILDWVKDRFNNVPKHTGKETTGLERASAYLKRINNEISKAIATDFDGKIDIGKLEEARREIYSAIDRLDEAHDGLSDKNYKKKKSDLSQEGLVKEGQRAARVGGIVITVPLIISTIARICINSTVSAGKDIEKTAIHMAKKYKLDDREWMELVQLLSDMNYPTHLDRGRVGEKIDTTSVDNYDWMPNYNA